MRTFLLIAATPLIVSSGIALGQDAGPAESANSAPATVTTTPDASSSTAPPGPGIVITTPAAAKFDSAISFFNAGQYADAIPAFSDFVRDYPNDRHREEALYRLAESYRNLGRTDDALAAYTFQARTYPDGPLRVNGELRRGAILFDAGKFSDAIAPLQFVVDKGDGELQLVAKYLLGRALLDTQKETDGRALLQGLVDLQPPAKFSGDAAQTLAGLDDTENHFSAALVLWQKALSLTTDPTVKGTAAARGGWSALQAKQPDVAEKLFQTARETDAGGDARKVANTGLLRLLFQQKRYGEWVALYSAEKEKLLEQSNRRVEIRFKFPKAK